MTDAMNFPKDYKDFIDDYAFRDQNEVYTNGSNLIPVIRVEQMVEHYFSCHDVSNSEQGHDDFTPQYDFDMVNHPNHYKASNGLECRDIQWAMTEDKIGMEAVDISNIVKYLFRYNKKNGLEDVKKAQNFMNHLVGVCERRYAIENSNKTFNKN